jgi:hypothetical protein
MDAKLLVVERVREPQLITERSCDTDSQLERGMCDGRFSDRSLLIRREHEDILVLRSDNTFT